MTPAYATKLGLTIQITSVKAEKIDGSILVIYGMIIGKFSIQNKLEKIWFFEKTFLLVDTSIEVVLEMPFLILSNADIWFIEKKLEWRKY